MQEEDPGKPDADAHDGAQRLARQIARVRALREAHARGASMGPSIDALRRWQAERLARTYADLAASERYAPATAFFLSDLYGERDFAERDESVERLYPVIVRSLPDAALDSVALALELHALTTELDRALWTVLTGELGVKDRITEAQYAESYRRCDNRAERLRQIGLVRTIGEGLERVVAKPLVLRMLKLARRPARLAGFGELQDFLERGFAAFKHMGRAAEFLDLIETRETRILENLFAGREHPFEASAP